MAFHVEIRRGRRWAREFNLDADRLRDEILDPWVTPRAIPLGDRDWEPADCSMRILEGAELSGPDLAFGRGWAQAQRSGRDVTRELVEGAVRESATVAVLAETDSARQAVLASLREIGVKAVDWAGGAAEAAGPAHVEPAALVLAVETSAPPRDWLFAAGAAVGAVGARAVVARIGGAPAPPELDGLVSTAPGRELGPALAEALQGLGAE